MNLDQRKEKDGEDVDDDAHDGGDIGS